MKHYFINFAYFQGSLCAKDYFSDDAVKKEFSLFCFVFFFPKKKGNESEYYVNHYYIIFLGYPNSVYLYQYKNNYNYCGPSCFKDFWSVDKFQQLKHDCVRLLFLHQVLLSMHNPEAICFDEFSKQCE